MIEYIRTIAIYVEDQERSVAFFIEKLGFEVRVQAPITPFIKWIEVAPPGAQTHLIIYPRSMMPEWKSRMPSVVFQCSDVEAAYQELCGRGVTFSDPPQAMAWGTFAAFVDLDGNEFVLRSGGA